MSRTSGFAARRRRNLFMLAVAGLLLLGLAYLDRVNLGQSNFLTGWIMFGLTLILILFNLRKRLPMLRLGRAAAWLQWHVYLGLLLMLLFLVHLDFALPNGGLEIGLALLFVLSGVSGVLGLWLSRRLPARLSRRGENVLFERIPAFRNHLRLEIEALVEQAAKEHGSKVLGELYRRHLWDYLCGPRNLLAHLFESRRPYHRLTGHLVAVERYLNARERALLADIKEHLKRKDDLDYQYAGQALLKAWLFVHLPLSYLMLLFVLAHLLVVYSFLGGL